MALADKHREHMTAELAGILSDKMVTLADPGNSLAATHLYANIENSKIDVVPCLNTRGRLEISTNSLNFGGVSTFQIPPGSFLGFCWITGSVSLNQYVFASKGWALLSAIESIKYQVSGSSSINNVQMSGESHADLVMAACMSQEKRESVILSAGDYLNTVSSGLTNQYFAIPLMLPWSSIDTHGAWPYDTSVLSSNIIIEIKWKPAYKIFSGFQAQTPTFPTQFNFLTLKAHQIDILGSSAFRVSSLMARDPSLVYTVPMGLVQSFQTTQTVTSAVAGSIVLSAMPQGQLAAILVKVVPASQEGISTNQNVIPGVGIAVDYMNLRYNGQDLIKYDNIKEKELVDLQQSDGNGFRYFTNGPTSISSATTATYTGYCNVLPFYFDIKGMWMDKAREHVSSYGGSTLEFLYRIDGYSLSSSSVNFYFTYIFNSLLECQNRITSIVV